MQWFPYRLGLPCFPFLFRNFKLLEPNGRIVPTNLRYDLFRRDLEKLLIRDIILIFKVDLGKLSNSFQNAVDKLSIQLRRAHQHWCKLFFYLFGLENCLVGHLIKLVLYSHMHENKESLAFPNVLEHPTCQCCFCSLWSVVRGHEVLSDEVSDVAI